MAENSMAMSVPIRADITLFDGRSVLAQLAELNSHGCYLGMLEPIPIGAEFGLRISDGIRTCELQGKVIYLHPSNGLGIFGIGVQFGKISAEQHSVIDAWLEEVAGMRNSASSLLVPTNYGGINGSMQHPLKSTQSLDV
jgi:hypothetical protein